MISRALVHRIQRSYPRIRGIVCGDTRLGHLPHIFFRKPPSPPFDPRPLAAGADRSVFGELGPTVSRLLLERFNMDIHCRASFLPLFTNLDDLSLLDPLVLSRPKPKYQPPPSSTKRIISVEPQIDLPHESDRFFSVELLQMPLYDGDQGIAAGSAWVIDPSQGLRL